MAQKLSDVAVGTIVKINENGSPVDYIVVNQGIPENNSLYDSSCDGTWVLRKDIAENRQWNSSNSNSYKASTIHSYLNGTFLNLFDSAVRQVIKQVKIPYVNGTGNSAVASGSSGLSCKIFLLSNREVGITASDYLHYPNDGAKLSYFESGSGDTANNKRIAKLNGSATNWWLRSPYILNTTMAADIATQGRFGIGNCTDSEGIRPAFILSNNSYIDNSGNIIVFSPTAPTSITLSPSSINQITITWTASTIDEGSIASYNLERQVDQSGWTQIFNGNALTYTDTVDDWATVQYRVRAISDQGIHSDYATSAVQDGLIYIAGPSSDLGDKLGQFNFTFTVDISGETSTITDIVTTVTLDSRQIYSQNVSSGQEISIPIDADSAGEGPHTIQIVANKTNYIGDNQTYTFNVPTVDLPESGKGTTLQDYLGNNILPTTLANLVKGINGKSLGGNLTEIYEYMNDTKAKIEIGNYVGTGTFGQNNPNTLTFSFEPKIVFVNGKNGVTTLPSPFIYGQTRVYVDTPYSSTTASTPNQLFLTWNGNSVSYYTSFDISQLNQSGMEYYYVAFG